MSSTETLLFNISSFAAGLFLLQHGAEKFMDHTAVVAKRLDVSPLLIGLLTCGAEWEGLVVIAVALSQKNPDLALGSVVGASIANILSSFSLGLLMMNAVEFDRSAKIYSAVLLAVTSLFIVLLATFTSSPRWLAGPLLEGAFVVYVASVVWLVYRRTPTPPEKNGIHSDSDSGSDSGSDTYNESLASDDESDLDLDSRTSQDEQSHQLLPLSKPPRHQKNSSKKQLRTRHLLPPKLARGSTNTNHAQKSIPYHLVHLTLGLAALLVSSYIIAHSATTIGNALSLSGTVVGTTILSLSTTLPDKFVAVLGGVRQQPGILVANAVGSNIFLATLCGGILFLAGGSEGLAFEGVVLEMGVMWLSAVAVLVIVLAGGRRWMGGVLMGGYGVFLVVEVPSRASTKEAPTLGFCSRHVADQTRTLCSFLPRRPASPRLDLPSPTCPRPSHDLALTSGVSLACTSAAPPQQNRPTFPCPTVHPFSSPSLALPNPQLSPAPRNHQPCPPPLHPTPAAPTARAWLGFASDRARRNHAQARRNRSPSPALSRDNAEKLAAIVAALAARHWEMHAGEGSGVAGGVGAPPDGVPVCCAELAIDASAELRREFCAVTRRRQRGVDHDRVLEGVMAQLARLRAVDPDGRAVPEAVAGLPLGTSPGQVVGSAGSRLAMASADGGLATSLPTTGSFIPARPPGLDDGISGKPFVRVEATPRSNRSSGVATPDDRVARVVARGRARGDSRASARPAAERLGDSTEVPVGISRLHNVSLPVLQMKPIYWSPVNDIATVLRATWFYRDTMVPVEPIVANQLEAGYRELRPWTETWGDELKSALDVGPLGEEKVAHRLWPEVADKRLKTKDGSLPEPAISADPFCAARCFCGEAAAEGTLEPVHSEKDTALPPPDARVYSKAHVIYKNGSTAFLLKPSQTPSAYYGRKPVAKIMKGLTVGMPVVRGFDRAAWEKVHEKRASSRTKNTGSGRHGSGLREAAEQGGCPGCRLDKDRGQVTDLILIAHGIGQKLSERVDSFHFTHVVNSFRRDINIELERPSIKAVLRPEQNGIMVLPVNWRHLLTLEDEGPASEAARDAYAPEGFTLKDIEPPTIPAVRNMISDVMFDVPFYMSHLKPKMIAALVGEANRVYRLWCRNNPGFAEKGRVHLIGHSLGSAMAIDILSRQPTHVPRLDLSTPLPDTRFFEFDTINLFLLGSPAAFFLLLERGGLVPRRGRLKPGADAADTVARDVVGEVGVFGCIAVDNIYNILAKEDPIAYLLNGTVDPVYAAALRPAYVPSLTTSFLDTLIRGITGAAPKPPAVSRLPSQLELEVHDFTREEIAERKAFLLNDNGQIDYFLRSGGGPLEMQYLNMLSAHSSYWTNQDLIRLLCLEVGRKPGRGNTLPGMRAAKAKGRFGGV
ncbi:hypothetical protein BT67DRAFT_389860 [Trichocladium antarcticum]|uniref:DDHD domain-containing protein n=1 Tax=Trichocladium antarcticum TaxID=1450529 RepID=A0AAN6UDX1_9PEZI|nr:hypothetical protein BT67DRAFT_389860 [Trichocladium antarcticum]